MTTSEDIEYLKLIHFFPKHVQVSDIQKNLHLKKIWADAFWRRRRKHSNRTDPEVKYLQKNNEQEIDKVLEIGAGYGRVSQKLVDLENINTVTGVEICHFFGDYVREYVDDDRIRFIFDDFLTTNSLRQHQFDLIILPMNTLATFPRVHLNKLFDRVRQFIKPRGKFVFSTYSERVRELKEERYDGELLVEMGEDPLVIEFYTMKDKINPWGMKSVTYSKYRYLSESEMSDMQYFQTERNLYHHDYLVDILADNHMSVISRDKIDHSAVFVCEIINEK